MAVDMNSDPYIHINFTRSGRRLSIEKSEKDDDVRSTASTPTKKRPSKRMSIKPDLEDVMETDAYAIQDFNDGNTLSQIMEENPLPDLLLKELKNMEFSSNVSLSQVKDSPSRNLRKRNTSTTSPEDTARTVHRKSPSSGSENIILNSPTKKRIVRKAENSILQNIVDSPKPRKKRSSIGGLEADTVQDTSMLRRSRRLSTDLNIVVEDPLREEQSDLISAPVTRKGKRLSTIPLQPSVPEENEDIKDSTSALTSPAVIQNTPSQRNQRRSPKAVSPNKSSNKQNSNLSKPNSSFEVDNRDSDLLDKSTDGKNASVSSSESKINVSTDKSNNRISISPKKRVLSYYSNELKTPEDTTRLNKISEIQYPIERSENANNKSLSQSQSELYVSTEEKANQPVNDSKLNSSLKSTAANTNVSGRSSKSPNHSHLDIDEIKSVSFKNIDESLTLNFSDNFEHKDDYNIDVSEKDTNKVNNASLKNNKSLCNILSEKSGIRDEKALKAFTRDNESRSENIDVGNSNEESIATSTPFLKSKKEKYKSTPPVSSGIIEESKDASTEGFEESSKVHTPDHRETPKRDVSNVYTQRNNINKSYKSSSEDEEGTTINFEDSASDAGSNYQSGDSMDESQRREIEMNEIVEKGESLHSETCESENDTYEKDSFICSSSEESNEKLTSDDAITETRDNYRRHFNELSKLSKSSDFTTISKSDNDVLSKSQPNLSGSTPKHAKMYSPSNITSTGELKSTVDKESKKRCSSENSNDMSNTSKSVSQTELSSSSDRTPNSKETTKDLLGKSLTSSLEKRNTDTDSKKRLSMNNSKTISKMNYSIDVEENDSPTNSSSNMSTPNSTQKIKNDKTEKNDSTKGESDTNSQVNISAGSISTPNSARQIKNATTERNTSKTRLSLDNSIHISNSNESGKGETDNLSNSQLNVSTGSTSIPNSTKKIKKDTTERNASKTRLSLDNSIHESATGETDNLSNSEVNVSAGSISTRNSIKKMKKDTTERNTSKTRLSLDNSIHISNSNESGKGETDNLSNSQLNASTGSTSTPNSTKKIKKDTTQRNASKTRLSLDNSIHESATGETDNLSNSEVNVSAGSISTRNSIKKMKKDTTERNTSKTRLSLDNSIHISNSNESGKGETDNLSNSQLNASTGSTSTPNSTKKIKKDTTQRNASKTRLSFNNSIHISKSNESSKSETNNLSNSQLNISADSIPTSNSTKQIKKDTTEKNASKTRLSMENLVHISKSNYSFKSDNENNMCNTGGAKEELVHNSASEALSRLTHNKMIDGSTDDSKMSNEDSPSVKTGISHLDVPIQDRSMEKRKNVPMSEVNYNIPPKETNKRFKPQLTAASDFEVESISIENLPIGTKRKLSETDPNWTCTAGQFQVAKKPKAKPTRPISVSYAGSTTSFSIIPLKKTPKQVLLADCEIEPKVLNFKQDMLYGSRCQRMDSSKLLKIQQKLKASKNKRT